jgi:hypothetical protein
VGFLIHTGIKTLRAHLGQEEPRKESRLTGSDK